MDREELKNKLSQAFKPSVVVLPENHGRGNRIKVKLSWPGNAMRVKYLRLQLCGMNPLTGEDVERDRIIIELDFDKVEDKTELLKYHGKFYMRCTAFLMDGTQVDFRNHRIELNYPPNKPCLTYKTKAQGDFTQVTMESNCWAGCRDKIWLCYDGHEQLMPVPGDGEQEVRVYLPASGNIEVKVQDDMVELKRGW